MWSPLSVVRSAVVAGRAGPPLRPGSRVSGVLSLWHTAHIEHVGHAHAHGLGLLDMDMPRGGCCAVCVLTDTVIHCVDDISLSGLSLTLSPRRVSWK